MASHRILKSLNPSVFAPVMLLSFMLDRLVFLAPIINAGFSVDQSILKTSEVVGVQALAALFAVLFARSKLSKMFSLSGLFFGSSVASGLVAMNLNQSYTLLGCLFCREIFSLVLSTRMIAVCSDYFGPNSEANSKKIQGYVAISLIFAFISCPFLVHNFGMNIIFAIDASLRLIALLFFLRKNPIFGTANRPEILCKFHAISAKDSVSEVTVKPYVSESVMYILRIIFLVSVMAGAMNVLEIPILVKNVRASPQEISVVLGIFAFAFLAGTYGTRKMSLSLYSRGLFYGSSAILGWSTAVFATSSSIITCSVAMVAFGLANSIFNQIYIFKFQLLSGPQEVAAASVAAAMCQRFGLFFTSSLIWIQIPEDIFVKISIGVCLVIPIFFVEKILSKPNAALWNFILTGVLMVSLGVPAQAGTNPRGHRLRILSEGIPPKMDPVDTRLISWGTIFNQVFDALYEYTENNTLKPLLAKKHVISPDGKRIKIFIDPKATFSDGTPLTAEIVANSLRRSTRLLGEGGRWAFGDVKGFDNFIGGGPSEKFGIQAVSDYEINIVLDRPFPYILQVLTAPNFLITKVDGLGNLIGTGDYMVQSLSKEEAVLIYRNDVIKAFKAPSSLIFKVVSSSKERQDSFVNKTTDLSVVTPQFDGAPDGFRSERYKFLRAMFILMNTKSQRFATSKQRCQFASGFERSIAKSSYRWERVFNGFPLAWDIFPELRSNDPVVSQIRDTRSTTVLFADSLSAHFNEEANATVALDLKSRGHNVTFKKVDLNQLSGAMASGSFEAIMIGYVPDYLDPDAIIFPLLRTRQLYNLAKYENPSVDNLIGLARQMSDVTSRNLVYKSLFEVISKECPVHFLGSEEGRYVISTDWKLPGLSGLGFYNLKLKNARYQGGDYQ